MKKILMCMVLAFTLIGGNCIFAMGLGSNTVCPIAIAYFSPTGYGQGTWIGADVLEPYGDCWNKFPDDQHNQFRGEFKVIVNNYTDHTFYAKGGETGENDGNFDFYDCPVFANDANFSNGESFSIGPKETNKEISARWTLRWGGDINDCCEPEIAVKLDDNGYGDWQDFGEVRINSAGEGYMSMGLNIWNNKYSFKVGDYYCNIFGVDNNTIQINFDNAAASNSNATGNSI